MGCWLSSWAPVDSRRGPPRLRYVHRDAERPPPTSASSTRPLRFATRIPGPSTARCSLRNFLNFRINSLLPARDLPFGMLASDVCPAPSTSQACALRVIDFRGMPDRLAVESVIEIAWNTHQPPLGGPLGAQCRRRAVRREGGWWRGGPATGAGAVGAARGLSTRLASGVVIDADAGEA